MRRSTSLLGLAAMVALGGCAFRPSGGLVDDDDRDGGVTVDGADGGAIDAAVTTDARTLDAGPAFDPSTCPSSYTAINGQASRYRVIGDATWPDAQLACRGHSQGLTHLAVFSGDDERDDVGTVLFFSGEYRRLWLGVWNDGTGAHTVTGEGLYPSTDLEAAQAVTWVRSLITPFRSDSTGSRFAALCECDGQASSF